MIWSASKQARLGIVYLPLACLIGGAHLHQICFNSIPIESVRSPRFMPAAAKLFSAI